MILSSRLPAGQDPLDRRPLELRAEDVPAVCLPPVVAHGASRCILRPKGEQPKQGALRAQVVLASVDNTGFEAPPFVSVTIVLRAIGLLTGGGARLYQEGL